jgi:hypothetical protein
MPGFFVEFSTDKGKAKAGSQMIREYTFAQVDPELHTVQQR